MSNQKIVFSKEIDNSLQGFSLVLTFVVMGIMLQFFPSFFGNVNKIVTIIFIIFVIMQKIKKVVLGLILKKIY